MSFQPVLYPSAPLTSCVLNPNQLSAFHKAGPKTRSIYTNVICQTNVKICQTSFPTNTEAANHIVWRTLYICPSILRSIFLKSCMLGLHAFGPCVHIHVFLLNMLNWNDHGYVMSTERLRLIIIRKTQTRAWCLSGLGHPRPFLSTPGTFSCGVTLWRQLLCLVYLET